MAKRQKKAVRNYLIALRDPDALRDKAALADLNTKLDESSDGLERLQLRQQILDLQRPSLEQYENAFIEHAKAWADSAGISSDAFAAEGVPSAVLRRAGFRAPTGSRGQARAGRVSTSRGTPTRTRVNADDIHAAIPSGLFRVKDLQARSGASAAVVRRVIQEQVNAGHLVDQGADPNHAGPGRAPTIYQRK